MTESNTIPFIEYVKEDKSKYTTAVEAGYVDPDGDFLVGDSGGFLFNINFVFRDTHLLRPAARYYEEFGTYSDMPEDSPAHIRYRKQEEHRRKHGFVANCKLLHKDVTKYERLMKIGREEEAKKLLLPLRISGEHYNFINYGVINKLDESSVTISKTGKVTGVKVDGIPIFFGSQYWWYKAKEFGKRNGFHLIVGKSRRAGFSYMEAIGSANTVNLYAGITVIHAGHEFKYLTEGRAISVMSLMQLEHYEANTPFKRGIISRKISDIHLGYKEKDGANAGYQSHLLSLATGTSNADVAIGKDGKEIKCEELSVFESFDKFIDVTEPTTRTGSIITGQIIAWGTGGSEDAKWEVFEKNFYNPSGYNFMPFENIWDKDSRGQVCGYFKPYIDSLQGFTHDGRASMDEDGNTNYDVALQISKEERADAKTKAKTIMEYIIHCGQYANCPSESFSSTTDNIFASPELSEYINKVRNNPDYKFYTDGMIQEQGGKYKFKSNFKLHDEGFKAHPYIEDVPPKSGGDKHGCIRIWNHPIRINGKVPDIYEVYYDPVGIDKDNPNAKNSYNSISVYMNPNEHFPGSPRIRVANFFGRPPSMEDADRIAMMMCMYYGGHNAMLLAEIDRGETKSNFKKFGTIRLMAKEPAMVWDTKVKPANINEIGIRLGNDIRKLQGLRLLKEQLYEKVGVRDDGEPVYAFEFIPDICYLTELQKWHNDGNFDRVSEAIIGAFAYKKKQITAAIKLKTRKSVRESALTREWA